MTFIEKSIAKNKEKKISTNELTNKLKTKNQLISFVIITNAAITHILWRELKRRLDRVIVKVHILYLSQAESYLLCHSKATWLMWLMVNRYGLPGLYETQPLSLTHGSSLVKATTLCPTI